MSTMKDLANMLGLELEEVFSIDKHGTEKQYRFTADGLYCRDGSSSWNCDDYGNVVIGLCNGTYKIVKLPWKPRNGERYWYVDIDGTPDFDTFSDDDVFALEHYACKNCFMTEDEARANINEVTNHLKAIYEQGEKEQKAKMDVKEAAMNIQSYCHKNSNCKKCPLSRRDGEGCTVLGYPNSWTLGGEDNA